MLAVVRRVTIPTARPAKGLAALSGAFDIAANILFVEALAIATLAVVSVAATLTPLIAAVLAFAFLGQRLARHQVVGLAVELIGAWIVTLCSPAFKPRRPHRQIAFQDPSARSHFGHSPLWTCPLWT